MIKPLSIKSYQVGFSLLETLVAFAILALVLAVIFQIYASGSRSTRLAHEYSVATLIAQSQLAAAQTGNTHDLSGVEHDKYHWTVHQQAHNYTDIGSNHSILSFLSYDLNASVTWQSAGKQHKVQLSTVRLVNKL